MLLRVDRIKILELSRTRERITIFSVLMHLKLFYGAESEKKSNTFGVVKQWNFLVFFHKFLAAELEKNLCGQ